MEEIRYMFKKITYKLEEIYGTKEVEIANKWEDGTLVLKPHDPDKKSYEIPIDNLFKKIISVREKLRVLEQKINNHPKLENTDKIEIQQYISRAYGSLTTFNILFKHDADKFHSNN